MIKNRSIIVRKMFSFLFILIFLVSPFIIYFCFYLNVPTLQTVFLILAFSTILFEIKFYGHILFKIKQFFCFKKSSNFLFILKILILFYFTLSIFIFFNNNLIFNSFNQKQQISFSGIVITLIGSLLGILNFYKKSQNDKLSSKQEQFYKLLDMLNSELEKFPKCTIDNIIKSIDEQFSYKIKNINPLLQFILLNTRIKKKSFILYFNYLRFYFMLKVMFFIDKLTKHNKYNKDDFKKMKNFINIINLFNNIQGSRAKSIPTKIQEQYTTILYSHIIYGNSNYEYISDFVSEIDFEVNDSVYIGLDKIGYIKYFSKLLPKKPKDGNEIWRYDVKYSYITAFRLINKEFNLKSNDSVNNICRLVHRIIKIVNHMPISVDEKYSLYGIVRSSLDSETLLAIFLNATFSFKGSGLSRQLIGTSFFGDKMDIDKSYSQHINLEYLESKVLRRLSKRILSNYYASYTYPGNINFKFLFIKLMISGKKIEKH